MKMSNNKSVMKCMPNQSIPYMNNAKLTVDLANIRVDALRIQNYTIFSRSYFNSDLSNFLSKERNYTRILCKIPEKYLKMIVTNQFIGGV